MVAKKLSSYEESREKRIEENRKRMEALNLPILSQALKSFSSPLKPSSPMKHARPRTLEKQVVVLRRSGRVSKKPASIYEEVVVERMGIPRRVVKRRDLSNRVYASDKARGKAIKKAERLQSGLDPAYPNFIKPMFQSYVSGGIWLRFPAHFCRRSLPKRNGVMTLIDENGDEYSTIYLARKAGLSGGWKGFAVAHDLADGDAVIFQLIRSTTFKVYIVRVNGSEGGSNL